MRSERIMLLIKDNTGAASVIEAVLVYPAVILSCIFLVWSGLYMCEESMLCDTAQKAAVYQSDAVLFGDSELANSLNEPGKRDIKKICDKKRKQRITSKNEELVRNTEERMEKMLLPQKKTECRIKTVQGINGCRISVSLERKICLPGLIKLLSKDKTLTEKAYAEELAVDFLKLKTARDNIRISSGSEKKDERNAENEVSEIQDR